MASRANWKVYSVALLAATLGMLARAALWPLMGDAVPFITFFPVIVLSGLYGGFRASMLTTVASTLASDWFLIAPRYSFKIGDRSHAISLGLFLLMGTFISWLTHERNMAIARLHDAHERERQARIATEEAAARAERLREEADRLREKAEAASRAKDEFLAMLGHELRNPLAPMVTALELMRLKRGGELAREEQVISRQVKHLCRMVDDLLDVSRIARGMIELHRKPLALTPVLVRSLEMASPLIESRGHHVKLDAPGEGLMVEGDPDRLAQVFANLLMNAAKYTDPGGNIDVSAAPRGDEIVVSVRDTGVGMSPELLAHVFEPFVQAEQGSSRSAGGLGLGLSVVRSLVSLHGGSVQAQSAGPGQGSELVVHLPAFTGETSAPATIDATPAHAHVPRQKVLIVDDNEDAANLLADALRAEGWPVAVAHDGVSALSLLDDFRPDVAVLDIGLPVMDGYELATRIRSRLGAGAPRLVALTGYGQARARESSAAAGFERHLIKPVRTEELIAILAGSP